MCEQCDFHERRIAQELLRADAGDAAQSAAHRRLAELHEQRLREVRAGHKVVSLVA